MTKAKTVHEDLPVRPAASGPSEEGVRLVNYIEDDQEQTQSTARVFSTAFGQSFTYPTATKPINPLKKVTLTIISTYLLIPGDGEPIHNAALVISDKLIVWVGSQFSIPSKYTSAPHKAVWTRYLMPGLWDCHLHFGSESPNEGNGGDYIGFVTLHPAINGARLTKNCWEAIQRGYTSVRDLAGMGCEVAVAVNEGTIVGPNIYSAGGCISQLGGHGDAHSLPAGVVLGNLGVSQIQPGFMGAGMTVIADGVDECRKATRMQIRRGAKCIKVMATGGVLSRDDDVTCAQFSHEELKTIVDEAARQKRNVAAHAHAKSGILAAVKAGVKSIEHGSFADEECIKLIKEKNVIYVATRFVIEMLLATGGKGVDPSSWEKLKLVAGTHMDAYKLAVEYGCTIALGSDTGPGDDGSAKELQYAVEAGLSNLEAIKAATANGPLTVGSQAPKTGQLKVGYEADILGLEMNPVEDVKVLQNKDNIKWVWKGGKLFKGPGIGPWGE